MMGRKRFPWWSDKARSMNLPNSQHPADQPIPEESLRHGTLAELLGIRVEFAPEELAPPVDFERLQRFVRHELPPDETHEVISLITSFRSWHEACAAVLSDHDDDQSAEETVRC